MPLKLTADFCSEDPKNGCDQKKPGCAAEEADRDERPKRHLRGPSGNGRDLKRYGCERGDRFVTRSFVAHRFEGLLQMTRFDRIHALDAGDVRR